MSSPYREQPPTFIPPEQPSADIPRWLLFSFAAGTIFILGAGFWTGLYSAPLLIVAALTGLGFGVRWFYHFMTGPK